ncbi:hypothetical protein [Desulfuromonas carbonis]
MLHDQKGISQGDGIFPFFEPKIDTAHFAEPDSKALTRRHDAIIGNRWGHVLERTGDYADRIEIEIDPVSLDLETAQWSRVIRSSTYTQLNQLTDCLLSLSRAEFRDVLRCCPVDRCPAARRQGNKAEAQDYGKSKHL